MIENLKKGESALFTQNYDKENNKPLIKFYSKKTNLYSLVNEKDSIGYGKAVLDLDNKLHLYPGKIDMAHLNKYKESKKRNLLKILVH